ncbi:Riboflavin synthase alpha chain [Nowakowskiella sp. JEL0407]|nr:Riboflavin synthase alpha chain [Nowakowskiella sp. JEL0407]
MFTGIVECMGEVAFFESDSGLLKIKNAGIVLADVNMGDSIAVNGVCLTVTAFDKDSFEVTVAPETKRLTNLVDLKPGDLVNLERALNSMSRFGGHMVQGHVDHTVTIQSIIPDPPNSVGYTFHVPAHPTPGSPDIFKYLIPKGFVCLNGTSLTITSVKKDERLFSVMLIPYTLENVNLKGTKVGDRINIEVDQISKYVESIVDNVLEEKLKSVKEEEEKRFEEFIKKFMREKTQ